MTNEKNNFKNIERILKECVERIDSQENKMRDKKRAYSKFYEIIESAKRNEYFKEEILLEYQRKLEESAKKNIFFTRADQNFFSPY